MNVRVLRERLMLGVITLLATASMIPIIAIIINVYSEGLKYVTPSFLIEFPPPPIGGEGGGIGPALVGSIILVGLAMMIGGSIGFFTGLYLSEFSHTKLAQYTQLFLQIMVEFPTIIVGLFAYTVLVIPLARFNALAGAFALSIVIIPYVALNVREAYKSIPFIIKEAAFSLGISYPKAYLRVLLSAARRGVLTALLIGMAKAAGETAPLLFTILGTAFVYFGGLDQPISAIPLLIYNFALSPYERWHQVAWGAAAILLTIILAIFILSRLVVKEVKL
ncbi:MAG: phosphate ABC transporter permease PstA [Nitrososphaerota archaeon]|nr:phosphate ABC transporter permease PstA [Nitrososphaerota archaeon]